MLPSMPHDSHFSCCHLSRSHHQRRSSYGLWSSSRTLYSLHCRAVKKRHTRLDSSQGRCLLHEHTLHLPGGKGLLWDESFFRSPARTSSRRLPHLKASETAGRDGISLYMYFSYSQFSLGRNLGDLSNFTY